MRRLLLLLLLAACAPRAEAPRTDIAALAPRGEARRCLLDRDIRDWQLVGEDYLLAKTGSGWFRNKLIGGCPGLDRRRIVVRTNSVGQACRGDTFGVIDPVTRNDFGLCRFGDWEPVEVPKGARF
ncbi:hypothetical protein IP88_00650 [alpha proteobacterium AAP81b]|nr:hypothetical protein IP88_00650 [alpha proteobacterium AAP81b]